jgi:thiamine transport system permease protein
VDLDRPRLTRPASGPGRALVVGLAALPAVFVAVFFAWPVVTLLARGLGADALVDTLGRRRTWEVVWFTLWQAVASTVLTVVLGLPAAFVVARYRFRGRRLLLGLLTAVFVLPTVVVGAAVLALAPPSFDHTVWAVLAAHVVFNLAVVVRVVGTMWEHVPPDLTAAAATLGAPPWRAALGVTLPLLRPALVAAASIVFLFTFTSFGVIRVVGAVGQPTLEVEIWRRATQLGDVAGAATLSVLQVAALAVFVTWSAVVQRRHRQALALRPTGPLRRPRGRRERATVATVAALTGFAVVAPLVALVERSLRGPDGYTTRAWRTLGRTEVRPGLAIGVDPIGALLTSLRTAAVATAIAVVVGGVAALAVAAARRGGRLLDAGLTLPLGTSAVTIGFGMLVTFDTAPVDWRASWWLVPLGHAMIAVPFVVRAALGVLRAVDPRLVEAAGTLGASPNRAWREVVVPHLWRPLATGAALAAAISLGEFGATSFLGRTGDETLPIVIDRLLGRTGGSFQAQGYAMAAVLAALTIVVVLVVDALAPDAVAGPARRRDQP